MYISGGPESSKDHNVVVNKYNRDIKVSVCVFHVYFIFPYFVSLKSASVQLLKICRKYIINHLV